MCDGSVIWTTIAVMRTIEGDRPDAVLCLPPAARLPFAWCHSPPAAGTHQRISPAGTQPPWSMRLVTHTVTLAIRHNHEGCVANEIGLRAARPLLAQVVVLTKEEQGGMVRVRGVIVHHCCQAAHPSLLHM